MCLISKLLFFLPACSIATHLNVAWALLRCQSCDRDGKQAQGLECHFSDRWWLTVHHCYHTRPFATDRFSWTNCYTASWQKLKKTQERDFQLGYCMMCAEVWSWRPIRNNHKNYKDNNTDKFLKIITNVKQPTAIMIKMSRNDNMLITFRIVS